MLYVHYESRKGVTMGKKRVFKFDEDKDREKIEIVKHVQKLESVNLRRLKIYIKGLLNR